MASVKREMNIENTVKGNYMQQGSCKLVIEVYEISEKLASFMRGFFFIL